MKFSQIILTIVVVTTLISCATLPNCESNLKSIYAVKNDEYCMNGDITFTLDKQDAKFKMSSGSSVTTVCVIPSYLDTVNKNFTLANAFYKSMRIDSANYKSEQCK